VSRFSRTAGSAPPDAEDRAKSRDFGQFRRLFRYLRPYRLQVAGAIVALVVAAVTVLGLGMGLRSLVDEGFSGPDATLLDQALIAMLGIVVVLAVASYSRFSLVSWLGERTVADLRRDVYDRVISLSPTFFETTRTGEVLSRLTTDTTLLQQVIGSSLSMALRNMLLFVGGTVMLAVTSPKLTGLVFLMVPIVLVPIIVFGRKVRRLSRASQDRIADVGARIDETLNAIPTVQAFAREPFERERFGATVEVAFKTAVQRIRARALLTAVVILFVFGGVGVVLWMGGQDVLSGRLSAGDLSAFVFYAVVVAASVGAVSEVYGDLQRAAGAAERLVELLDVGSDIEAPANPAMLPVPSPGTVEMRDVAFSYPSRSDRSALDGFDLKVAGGETVALVGPSGAGKTTVFQLLLRFYDPARGTVMVDGVDVRQLVPSALRERLALVPQDPVIFGATVADNILYGRPDASAEEVQEAARAAHALNFIEQLPDGFESFLGERGTRLSGGQRQRIAIARAILKDAPILLLDEATSALDAESEHAVQQALDELMQNRTTIVIAHRLATVLKADRIVVMDQGRIVDEGRHHELVARDGLYARLAELQFEQAVGDHIDAAKAI